VFSCIRVKYDGKSVTELWGLHSLQRGGEVLEDKCTISV